VLLFVRSGETTPLSTMAVRVTVQTTDAFKYCKLRFRYGILLKGSCKSHTFQDLSL
jgi:hypothetical protein